MDKRFSILTDDLSRCMVCGRRQHIDKHEIFFGSLRKKSIKYGLVVPLCHEIHHQGTDGVHGKNGRELDLHLKWLGQMAFEREYPDLDFIEEFGRNYL